MDAAEPDVIRRAIEAGTRALELERHERAEARRLTALASRDEARPTHPPLIYYMRLDNLVKIGTTTWLARRVQEIKPQGVMAVEGGGRDEERLRHQQFADLRQRGEWFRLDARLGEHIAELRQRFEVEMGEPLETWFRRQKPPSTTQYRRRSIKIANRYADCPPVVVGQHPDVTLLPAALAARAVGISPQLFDVWRRTGKVIPAAVTKKGRKLYRLTDVLAVPRRRAPA